MADNMEALEEWVGPLLAKLSAKERLKLAKGVATDLRRSQVARIKSQKNPDGSKFKARKPRKKYQPKNDPVRFLYKKPGGALREANMVSWQDEGLRMTGYDREVNAIRTFRRDRIETWLKPTSGGSDAGKLRSQQGRIRDKAMFNKLRTTKYLKVKGSSSAATVAFYGGIANIARVHQLGLRDRVSPDGPQVNYAQRELLGFSTHDREMIMDSVLRHLEGG